MNYFIISEDVLKSLMCDECGKYLSVLPIVVTIDGKKTICGRCGSSERKGKISPVQTKFKYGLFPCANRYDGCNYLLSFNEAKKHEESCNWKKYRCFNCKYLSLPILTLLHHFKSNHPKKIFNFLKFTWTINKDFEETYLYHSNVICYVNVRFVKDEYSLRIQTVHLGSNSNTQLLHQTLFIEKMDEMYVSNCNSKRIGCNPYDEPPKNVILVNLRNLNKFSEKVQRIYCKLIINSTKINTPFLISLSDTTEKFEKGTQTDCTKSTISEHFSQNFKNTTSNSTQSFDSTRLMGAFLTDDFKNEYPEFSISICGTRIISKNSPTKKISLVCLNCRHFTGTNVFSCSKGHTFCWDCNKWCTICTRDVSFDGIVSSYNEKIEIPCRHHCNTLLLGDKLRHHENTCMFKGKKWPDD